MKESSKDGSQSLGVNELVRKRIRALSPYRDDMEIVHRPSGTLIMINLAPGEEIQDHKIWELLFPKESQNEEKR